MVLSRRKGGTIDDVTDETIPETVPAADVTVFVPSKQMTAEQTYAPDETVTAEAEQQKEEEETVMKLKIDDTEVTVKWENNDSVKALKELCGDDGLEIEMSMYGGFEQVGSIGERLPHSDNRITTNAGDVVLYSGNQIVIFYGSNSWEYTRLGKITDKSVEELNELLGSCDVTVTLAVE